MVSIGQYTIGRIKDFEFGVDLDLKEDEFIVEGIERELSGCCVLLEKQSITQKHAEDGYAPADYFDMRFEHGTDIINKPYLVIIFGDIRNKAYPFSDLEEARDYYQKNAVEED